MDLFAAMFAKGVILTIWGMWADHRDAKKAERELLAADEHGGSYRASQPLLRLPAPEHATDLADGSGTLR